MIIFERATRIYKIFIFWYVRNLSQKGGSKWVQGPDELGTLIWLINTLEHVYKWKRGYKLPKKSLNNHQYHQKFHFCFQFQPKFSKIGILFLGHPVSGESFLSLFRRNQELVLDTIRKPLKLEKSFLYENRSEFRLQYDAVKNYYEKGNHKVPF